MLVTRLLFSASFLLAYKGVNGFFYRAIPMYVRNGKLISDDTDIGPSTTTISKKAAGRQCKRMESGVYLVNPYSQHCPIGKTKCGPEFDDSLGKCAMYSGCHTITDETRACTCLPGYFGNPYQQCFRHCETDLDCPSPYAECRQDPGDQLKRCKCRNGCPGDGVICKPTSICKETEEDSVAHRKCLQTGIDVKTYVCDDGFYLDTSNRCQPIVDLDDDRLVSVIANKYVDGSRIDIGKCFSMEVNKETGQSYFYQLNSGDPVVIEEKIKTNGQLLVLFEVKVNDIVAFATLESKPTKLTKLFTISNGLKGCKIDSVIRYNPEGVRVHPTDVHVEVKELDGSHETRQEL
ncbi:hypothetical protein BaOVIS_014100 [Babesia ovis]|uniref:12D3 antigen n=1 Tax=Babesia ovis TaxID=5869 RepID=A0A9W5TAW4_BABOV|nr:hypothetical protein BaOVIS_014100 [Babesia ovis]